ncbi:transcription factor RFX4-like [Styela clava]
MASDKNDDLLDLLVQNPDSLSREDLEKLCEAISKDTLTTEIGTTRSGDLVTPFHGYVPSRESCTQPVCASEVLAATNSLVDLNQKEDVEKHSTHNILQSLTTNTQQGIRSLNTGPISFRPITVSIPRQRPICSIPQVSSRDNCHTFQYASNHATSSAEMKRHPEKENRPQILAKRTASNGIGGSNPQPIYVKHLEDDDEVKIATLRGVPDKNEENGAAVGMLVNHHGNMAIAYPIGPYHSNVFEDNLYGYRRMQVRYTVPCSEQAVATTTWLMENFEENLMTTVPRSVMYQEYVRYFEKDGRFRHFNQAVFGKMVRSCFPNLTTRRLGIRGHSRYHYAGLGVKSSSIYANHVFAKLETNVVRTTTGHKKQNSRGQMNVAANVTVECCEEQGKSNKSTKNIEVEKPIPPKKNKKSGIPTVYPGMRELKPILDIDHTRLNSFLNFYSRYNKQFLSYITALDHLKTKDHLQNFTVYLPYDCTDLLQHPTIVDIIKIYDTILYKKATENLLPDCLASLSTDFKVAVRKFAKTFVQWVPDVAAICDVPDKVHETRLGAATAWGDCVRRMTTLCHVAKEARKALRDHGLTKQLRVDLEMISIEEIALMCGWAGNDATMTENYNVDEHRDVITQEIAIAKKYLSVFIRMLKEHAAIEEYITVLDAIVSEHGGAPNIDYNREDDTRKRRAAISQQFLMKWALYTSKMLSEITLRTSGSVGTFHLVSLLFGDYVSHSLCTQNEEVVFMKVYKRIINEAMAQD